MAYINNKTSKWRSISQKNFFATEFFTRPNEVAQAQLDFENTVKMDDDSYYTYAAILNALLISFTDGTNRFHDIKRIESLLYKFDQLLYSNVLNSTETLTPSQRFVRSMLYARLGDYLMISSLKDYKHQSQSHRSQSDVSSQSSRITNASGLPAGADYFLALCSYAIAYEYITAAVNFSHSTGDKIARANDCLVAIELYLIIKKSFDLNIFTKDELLKELKNSRINKKLYNRFAPQYSRIHKNNHDEVHSFIAEDKVHINKKTFAFSKNIDESISQNLSNVWQLRKDFHFLRRLAWILKQFDDRIEKGDKDKYDFVDKLDGRLKRFAPELDPLNSPWSLAYLDIKIFFFRMVHDFDLADGQINVGENQKLIFSWICFQKPYTSQQNFWDATNAVLETAETERLDLPKIMSITNGLEQIRFPSNMEVTDRVTLCNTMQYLEKRALQKSQEVHSAEKERAIMMELAENYARAIIMTTSASLDHTHRGSKNTPFGASSQQKNLFPMSRHRTPSSVALEDFLMDSAHIFLARQMFAAGHYTLAKDNLAEVSEQRNNTDEFKKLYTRIEKKLNEAFGYKVIKEAEKSEKTDDSFRTALSEIGSPGRRPLHQESPSQDEKESDHTTTLQPIEALQPIETHVEHPIDMTSQHLAATLDQVGALLDRMTIHNLTLLKLWNQ